MHFRFSCPSSFALPEYARTACKVTIKLATMAPEGSVFHNTLKDMGRHENPF